MEKRMSVFDKISRFINERPSETDELSITLTDIREICAINQKLCRYEYEKKKGGWIPVDERLPEEPYGCLVTVWDCEPTGVGDDFENILPYFVGYDGKQWHDWEGQQCPFEVIAWQPLPQPYKEEIK